MGDAAPSIDWDHPSRWTLRRAIVTGCVFTGLSTVGLLVPAFFSDDPLHHRLFRTITVMIAMLPVVVGVTVVVAGFRHRIGDEPRCASCEYPRAAGGGEHCSECGAEWSKKHGLVIGRPQRQRGWIIGGVMCSLFGLLLLAAVVEYSYEVRPYLTPTELLVGDFERRPYSFGLELQVLGTRSLTPEQADRVASALIESWANRGYTTIEETVWFERQIESGVLSAAHEAAFEARRATKNLPLRP